MMSAGGRTDHAGDSDGAISLVAFGVALLATGSALWIGFHTASTLLIPTPFDLLVAVVLTGVPLVSVTAFALTTEEVLTRDLTASVLLVTVGVFAFLLLVALTVAAPLAPFSLVISIVLAALLVLVLGGAAALITPIVLVTIGSSGTWALAVRMGLSLLLLLIVFCWLLGFVWVSVFLLATVIFGPLAGIVFAGVVTTGLTALLLYREYGQIDVLEQRADATVTTAADLPDLHAMTSRIAAQMNVPMPTIAISRTHTPEAMVAGFRPSNTHLVLSYGAVTALSDEELEAVIAHELAHIKNRDAMVMTILSLPVVFADGFRMWVWETLVERDEGRDQTSNSRNSRDDTEWETPDADEEWTREDIFGPNDEWFQDRDPNAKQSTNNDNAPERVGILLAAIMTLAWALSRATVSMLSRTREAAADRTAAEVTGSPIALADALRELDDQISATPTEDLREVASVSSMSILPIDPTDRGEIAEWPLPEPVERVSERLFRTHPPTTQRLDDLETLARERA